MTTQVIYDLGANNGGDIPYYLLKGDLVVAVEANPALCDLIQAKFKVEIEQGRLVVENCVVKAEGESGEVDFYIHNVHHVLSQLPRPDADVIDGYEQVSLPSKTIADIIGQYGPPHYIKIDIEHYDAQILRALFAADIRPPYISSESHSIEIFALLVAQGGYDAFKLVDGRTVAEVYANHTITSHQGEKIAISFPGHAAGPFGEDVEGPWMSGSDFVQVLAIEGLGWKDIHATHRHQAATKPASLLKHLVGYVDRKSKAKSREMIKRFGKALPWGRRSAA
ncbi:FkbM family methyltransferase [Blastopirellula retiformator]|uniref:Methyltransferase FkbM domain-containing protein n=1 Tax=Blastopirellula retiformator TaxID=2527970 RepID=A0A5C5UTX3_9BACT|nr:FkbM family methyltransferase [Blastopirellula retiformator]TWT29696.1 hypothetical protein Enr8_48840 [Blastopirellula retiformator]